MFKNITKITTVAALTLFTIVCDKDEITPINSVNTTTSTADGERLAQQVTQQAYAKLATFTKTDWIDKATPLKAQLEVNGKLYNDKSGTPVALEDIFFLHEGVINSIFTVASDPEDELEIFEAEVEVEVYEENGDYLIAINDHNQFYADVASVLTAQVQPTNGDYLSMTDLSLNAINGNTALVNVKAFVSTPPVSPLVNLTPGGAMHGVDLDGWCATNTGNIDAATILNGYIQPFMASNNAGSGCSNRMLFIMGNYYTNNSGQAAAYGLNYTNILNNVWKDNSNSCVGDDNNSANNNAIWNNWYAKTYANIMIPLPFYAASITQPNTTAVIISGTIEGISPFANPGFYVQSGFTHFHLGKYFYGMEIC